MRQRRGALFALMSLLGACGGHVKDDPTPVEPSAEGGAAGAPVDEPPLANSGQSSSAGADGQAAGGNAGEATAGAAGDPAGAPPAGPTGPPIGSGTRYCENGLYCFGLDCYAPADLPATVCIAGCATDADCAVNEVCLESADLSAGCYPRCDTPFDCEYGFDCFDFANEQQMLVCFPTPWASLWPRERR